MESCGVRLSLAAFFASILAVPADVAELVDAQVSEACGSNPVEVRFLSSAPQILIQRATHRRSPFLLQKKTEITKQTEITEQTER